MKAIYCSDAGYDCETVILAPTAEKVLNFALAHIREVHGEKTTPELIEQLTELIKEE
jgi:predicted small metal-binding protein